VTRPPYAPGDAVRVLHSCAGRGTELASLTVEWCKPLATNGRYRIRTTRCDGTPLEAEVGPDGRDDHGYIEPDRGAA